MWHFWGLCDGNKDFKRFADRRAYHFTPFILHLYSHQCMALHFHPKIDEKKRKGKLNGYEESFWIEAWQSSLCSRHPWTHIHTYAKQLRFINFDMCGIDHRVNECDIFIYTYIVIRWCGLMWTMFISHNVNHLIEQMRVRTKIYLFT